MNNNSLAILIVGVVGFLTILIGGKWLLDSRRSEIVQPYVQPQQRQRDININVRPHPQVYPQYHGKNEFWYGYRDGYNGRPICDGCPEYMQGYRVGQYDRQQGCHTYYDQHCPPGFSLKTPGFRLDIK